MPIQSLHWSPIIYVDGMLGSKFPIAGQNASLMVHCLSFVHHDVYESCYTTILLGGVWSTLQNFNSVLLQKCIKSIGFVFPSNIGHPVYYFGVVLCGNQCDKITCMLNGFTFGPHA